MSGADDKTVTVVGGGLAGCEAALQLAARGRSVRLKEMRPVRGTPAHRTELLGELVCTNSFKSESPTNAHGQLKREMRALGSVLLRSAEESRVPAGSALAVDRALFAEAMSTRVTEDPCVEVVRAEVEKLPHGPAVIATGPLTSDALSASIRGVLGDEGLAFFDAIAPVVHRESLDDDIVFAAGRFEESRDYLNCPLSKGEYGALVPALRSAEVHEAHDWDAAPYFEGCLPVEVLAARGEDTLRFGPMKPIGLIDLRTGRRPWAVVQLRREDRARPDVEPGGLPDASKDPGPAARVSHHSGAPQGRVPALGLDPPQQLSELSGPAVSLRVPSRTTGPVLRRSAHGRRGLHRVCGLGDLGGNQSRSCAGGTGPHASAADHGARRLVAISAGKQARSFPADELELGLGGSASGRTSG